jgi:hypothetical protein
LWSNGITPDEARRKADALRPVEGSSPENDKASDQGTTGV